MHLKVEMKRRIEQPDFLDLFLQVDIRPIVFGRSSRPRVRRRSLAYLCSAEDFLSVKVGDLAHLVCTALG
jgi:hypothetical protein